MQMAGEVDHTKDLRGTCPDLHTQFPDDPADPAVFDYNSIATNPTFSELAAGATSGLLPVSDGDTLQWECHIINDSNVALAYTNEVKTGEMCNTWGFTVGTMPIQCGVP
jgi:hypothetical protein